MEPGKPPLEINSYRSVSLLPAISKSLIKILVKRFKTYYEGSQPRNKLASRLMKLQCSDGLPSTARGGQLTDIVLHFINV